MRYMAHFTNDEAVHEWEEFADGLRRGLIERDYMTDLDMRESFETSERTLTDAQRAAVEHADRFVRERLISVLQTHHLIEEYRNLGASRPPKFWWWHMEE